jgi:hypothetical protein
MRVRKNSDGRSEMPPGSYAPHSRVVCTLDGDKGTVISMDKYGITVRWDGASISVVYPDEVVTSMIRGAFPWE